MDEGLWILSLEDNTKPRQKVSWDEHWLEEYEQVDDHEFMIGSGSRLNSYLRVSLADGTSPRKSGGDDWRKVC